MNLKDVIASEQVLYRKPIGIIEERLRWMNKKPQSDIRIYPYYPSSNWEATVVVDLRVYLFKCLRGRISLTIHPLLGFRPNGSLIIK